MTVQPDQVPAVTTTAGTTPPAKPFTVTQPGVYLGVSDDDYHRDPVPGGSLSSTGARDLLPPSCPALFRHKRDNPQPVKKVFELGHAAHTMMLGAGPGPVMIAGDSKSGPDVWNTNAVKEKVQRARAEGKVPLRPSDYERVQAMAAKLREHPVAAQLLKPGAGDPEASLFWVDPETRVKCRARIDWLTRSTGGPRLIVPDYKTCRSAAPDDLVKAIAEHGWHRQADWYQSGIRALGLHADPVVVFIAQEKEPPYLVTVAQPDPTALRIAAHLNREARHLYRSCTESGRWPGYSDDVALISLPGWVERQYEMELSQ
ncbi:hypothetical protein FJK98_02270 [Micromonospora sp. HM134]|uniref:PD-(D/E)XK nuclease-like domain-containing protein n=1 Tax=Micromonospora sp. HM134 TaxID=2583243 RepID=UPI0011982B12|nr:PD-(D/E)XK nuclease-like domain-containing protein [Micromonospora sp. HM134]QDY06130.1 hypothetical protein FJK98_02270 [Micromonospora sp. HM134]